MTPAHDGERQCYLCEGRFAADQYTEHYNARHLPRLLVPAGVREPGSASIRELLRQSADAPALMADLLVLLHHGSAEITSAQEQLEVDGGVGTLLAHIDDAVALLVLARQTVVDAVVAGGPALLGDGKAG